MALNEAGTSALIRVWAHEATLASVDNDRYASGYANGERPPANEHNTLFKEITRGLNHVLQNGIPLWISSKLYEIGNAVNHNGVIYVAVSSNTASEPTAVNANWKALAPQSEVEIAKARTRNYMNIQGTLLYTSSTVVTFTGEIVCMDSTNAHQIVIPAGETVAMTSLAVDEWYHFYAVKNITTNAVDIVRSTNSNLTTAPSGFDVLRKLPVSVPTDGDGEMRLFDCLIGQGVTRFFFREESADLDLFENVTGTPVLVNCTKVVPTGETGATCTISMEINGSGDANNSIATILEKSIDNQATYRRFASFAGNDAVVLEYPISEFTIRPDTRSFYIRQVSGVGTGNKGQATGYAKYW